MYLISNTYDANKNFLYIDIRIYLLYLNIIRKFRSFAVFSLIREIKFRETVKKHVKIKKRKDLKRIFRKYKKTFNRQLEFRENLIS